MLQIFKNKPNFNFIKYSNIITIISVLLMCVCIYLIATMNYGVDFRGGAEIQIKFNNAITSGELRQKLTEINLSNIQLQQIGNPEDLEFLLKVPASEENLNEASKELETNLLKLFPDVEIRKTEIVGPKAGSALKVSAIKALAWALIAIMIYVGIRFEFTFAPGAAFALLHDIVITTGIFAILKFEFDLQTVAALMAIVGYSVNDTVVIYDRVRENTSKYPEKPLSELINMSINDTFSRTILTSATTMFMSLSLLFLGGAAIRNFFVAMSIGIVAGTYSSLYISSTITLLMNRFFKKG